MLRNIVRELTPPVLSRWVRDLAGRHLRYVEGPKDWRAALAQSTGYDQACILERVAHATREVVEGRARFERDSVLFQRPEFRFPVVAALLRQASLHGSRLNVVDFGGALGSAYWQSRHLLDGVLSIDWRVVEQPHYVSRGRRDFSNNHLSFHETIALASAPLEHGLGLVGGALQFVESPKDVLGELRATRLTHLLIDRVPISDEPLSRVCIQITPRSIYAATYPLWILSREELLDWLQPDWRVLAEFDCDEGRCRTNRGFVFEYGGLYLERVA